jgi:single-stranded-DNA-specific exonuclease
MKDMRWYLPEASAAATAVELSHALGVHPLAARVLAHRGFRTPEAVTTFLDDGLATLPDPFRMKGLTAAVDRLHRAVLARDAITLYGDYDVDGVCSTALLSTFLEALGTKVATYIPHRLGEGYGLNGPAIDRIADSGTRLLVTLDCGITSHAEVSRANARGMEVIVVDHHAVPETMPPALAVLNPLQPGCDYPTKGLCAAGVAFNLCMGLRKTLRERGFFSTERPEPNLKQYLDLVALATVADVVPLQGANRVLVKHGLEQLSLARRPGVRALKEVCGMDPSGPVSAVHVGFRLGPRINAAGRLDDASLGLQLLKSRDVAQALPLARLLDEANAERQAIERAMLEGALTQAGTCVDRGAKGLVLSSEDWHPGVVGIVASRVVERFHRPAVLIGIHEGLGRGSARSIEGFHLYDALKECSGHLAKFGGHRVAAGLSILPEHLPAFRAAFEHVAGERLTEADLVSRCRIDAVVEPAELDFRALEALAKLGPFGNGNPEPVFALRGVRSQPKLLANKKEGEEGHLKLRVDGASALDVIGFRMASKLELTKGEVDLAFHAGVDSWNGNVRIQLKLKDVRAAA